jgi:phosphoribosylaminoimidazole (AIR) synthetase
MNLMNNETKQTAVDWLIEQLTRPTANYIPIFEIINKAKEMEKEQIINAFNNGENKSAQLYYNETYGGNNER